jgi:stress-induced-phosphoprotein 1
MEMYDKAIERKMKNLELELKKQEKMAYVNPQLGLEAKERGNQYFRDGNYPDAIKVSKPYLA